MRFAERPITPKWLLFLVLCVAALAGSASIKRLITTARLIAVVGQAASANEGKEPGIREEKITRNMEGLEKEAIVYGPLSSSATSAVILIPGVSELGCHHPRLAALSRSLAGAGFLILTPDIKMLREFRIYPPPLDEISFWLHEVHQVEGARKLRRVGLAGISFSATLALIAAAEPKNRGLASYVVGIGAFDDLIRCSHFWFDAGPVTVAPGYYPTRFYAKWIIMLAAAGMLPTEGDRQFIEQVLRTLLLQQRPPALPVSLTEEGRRWHRLALMREDQEDSQLSQQIENHVTAILYPELSTGKPAAEIRCPVFLAHGAYDDLIPPDESRRLRGRIINADSYLLITPFLTHTHPSGKPIAWREKTTGVLTLFAFFYHLSGVV